jgi:soluble lytic murein transglycosylase-like protein
VRRVRTYLGEHTGLLLLLAAGLALLVVEGAIEGPRLVRQTWSLVGVRRVEEHAGLLRAAAAESGMDPCLLAGVMYVESRGRVDAVSSAGALGLFQLMPASAGDAAKRLRLPEPSRAELLADGALNARLAASHLRWLYRLEGPELERVLVAYNAGRGKLRRWVSDAGSWRAWREQQMREGDSETLTYAQQVLEFAERFRERGVIAPPEPAPATVQAAEPAR